MKLSLLYRTLTGPSESKSSIGGMSLVIQKLLKEDS